MSAKENEQTGKLPVTVAEGLAALPVPVEPVGKPKRGVLTLTVGETGHVTAGEFPRMWADVTLTWRHETYFDGAKWCNAGVTVAGEIPPKAIGESAYDGEQDGFAYSMRSIAQAVGNRVYRQIVPREAGERTVNLSQLRQDAEKATDAVIAAMPEVVRGTITPDIREAMVVANYTGLIAAKTERRAEREAAEQKKANGGLPPKGAPGALTGIPGTNGGSVR